MHFGMDFEAETQEQSVSSIKSNGSGSAHGSEHSPSSGNKSARSGNSMPLTFMKAHKHGMSFFAGSWVIPMYRIEFTSPEV